MVSSQLFPDIWITALIGGMLIGLAAILLYATLGRIAGISGILYAALWNRPHAWPLAFLTGLMTGGWLAVLFGFPLPVGITGHSGMVLLALGGLLVGYGTRLGSGCTSGHGVCGLGRLSPRSLAAVMTFMILGMATATWLRPLLAGWLDA